MCAENPPQLPLKELEADTILESNNPPTEGAPNSPNSPVEKPGDDEPSPKVLDSNLSDSPPDPIPQPSEEILHLGALEELISLTYSGLRTRTNSIMKSDTERLTGRQSIISMNRSSTRLEYKCQYLEDRHDMFLAHCPFIHRAMDKLKLNPSFRPFFLCKREKSYTKFTLLILGKVSKSVKETRAKFKRLETGDLASITIRGTRQVITEDSLPTFWTFLLRIEFKLEISWTVYYRRMKYLTKEKLGITRLLSACRRLKAIQRDRIWVAEENLCICCDQEWEPEIWAQLGLPAISLPAGSQGFTPL
ncbi:hypothetical protein AOL_s00215g607 [Orbilia oligospora ATCC 24927]|uniref:Uncharacterized protein n=1 Tax=Arthrobotrys oligospora (strain ATCC 24927 / CBS 115.81 / DSM 1491) TaxID=756982 RepID=G1XUE9_ARTOA|nr:hypothetical protein AOL_s00215g607 [Orbilia oligospora ATCC 24927]EGX43233.1 hypothetical protein AOL_s00215g607 [Orbilia oligospora ATCC 24927]